LSAVGLKDEEQRQAVSWLPQLLFV
jgi:hypothetical protein